MKSQSQRNENTIARVGETYRHFKGAAYKVLAIATHSESAEPLVVYTCVTTGVTWARPRWMFEDGRFLRVREGGEA